MRTATLMLTTAMTLAGLLIAPAVLGAAGIDASAADVAPGADADSFRQCAGVEDEDGSGTGRCAETWDLAGTCPLGIDNLLGGHCI